MQYKIPQNVQRTDRILGPFTLKQFLYLLSGSFAGYIMYSLVKNLTGSSEAGFTLGIITLAGLASFAVIEIQGKPLPDFITAFIMFNMRPRHRIWQKDIYVPDIAYIPSQKKEGEEEVSQPKDISQMKTELEKLAHVLDTRGWGELAEETEEVEEEPLPGEEYEEEEAEEEETPAKEPEKAEPKISDKELGKERKAKIKEWHKVKKEVEKELEAAAIPTEKPAIRPAEEKMPEAKEVLPTEPEIKPEAAQKQTPPPKVPEPPIAMKAEEVQFKQTPAPPKPPQAAPAQKKILPAPLPEKVLPAPSRLSRARQVKRQVAQTISQMEKGIAKKAVEQKEMIKKFKSTVSEIEKIFQKPPKPKAPKKLEVNIIPSVSLARGTPTEETKEEPYIEEYKINLGNRITTPRVSEPATNIKVDETRLEDVLEGAQKMKTLKKELKEVGVAMEKQRHKKKPHIIKSGESIVDLEKKKE